MELRIENLTKRYGDITALDGMTMTFHEGIYGILGSNGAGKSTLMNLLADNVARDSGNILFNGEEILKMGVNYRQEIGYMPQQQGVYEQFSGRVFLYYMAEMKGIPRKKAKDQIEDLLSLVNLKDNAHRKVAGYSGGMRQRLLLAQALLGDPSILLLDEPTAGLDPKERIRLRNYIKTLSERRIVLLATHIVSDLESIANQILLMKKGRLIKSGSVQELLSDVGEKLASTVTRNLSLEDVYMHYLGDEEGDPL